MLLKSNEKQLLISLESYQNTKIIKGVDCMLYEAHEVEHGTELPIYESQEVDHFTLEDILNTDQSLEDFQRCGFVKTSKYERTLYYPVYERKGA